MSDAATPAPKKKGKAVINLDDRYGAILVKRYGKDIPMITYGVGVHADFRASNVRIDFNGTSYQLDAGGRSYLVRLPLIGQFNVYNSLAALAATSAMGVDVRSGVLALASATLGLIQLTMGAGSPLYFYHVTNEDSSVGFFSNANHLALFLAGAIVIALAWLADAMTVSGRIPAPAAVAPS